MNRTTKIAALCSTSLALILGFSLGQTPAAFGQQPAGAKGKGGFGKSDPRVQQRLRATTREAFANGVSGWVDDDLAFTVPWGFDVSELEVPVEIRYGATDVLVPAAHGAWLAAHVPNAIVTVDDTGGHLSNPDEGLEQLRELVTA